MAEPFIAEIRIFAGNFAPRGWAFCNGALLPISSNTALFSLIGTTYGGDGRTTLALPDLQGRAPMHPGRGPGLTTRRLGERSGVQSVTLTETQIPSHSHTLTGATEESDLTVPSPTSMPGSDNNVYGTATDLVNMNAAAATSTGGGLPHNNIQPLLALNFIIALTGLYPARS